MKIIISNTNKHIEKYCNSIARKAGYGSATLIVLGETDTVVSHTSFGYRKKSNYQHAETIVSITPEAYNKLMEN